MKTFRVKGTVEIGFESEVVVGDQRWEEEEVRSLFEKPRVHNVTKGGESAPTLYWERPDEVTSPIVKWETQWGAESAACIEEVKRGGAHGVKWICVGGKDRWSSSLATPRFSLDSIERHEDFDPNTYVFTGEMIRRCRPLFDNLRTHYEVARRLEHAGVLDDDCVIDPEFGHLSIFFRDEATASAFIERLNTYLVQKAEKMVAAWEFLRRRVANLGVALADVTNDRSKKRAEE